MNSFSSNPSRNWRYISIIVILILAIMGLIWRMVYLTILNRDFLQEQGNARTLRVIDTPAYRGMIRDRNGEPLAISTPVDSVWINPQEFDPTSQKAKALVASLDLSMSDIQQRIKKNVEREFLYLKRGIDPVLGQRIMNMNIPGVSLQREYRRFYPESEVTAHLLGFTNIDDQGQEGLELAYNQWLAGIPGRKRVLKDRLGHTVAEINILRAPRPGHDLVLSIDRRIQYLAYRELKDGVEKFQASSGSAIVIDIKTGEVLAMVNQPSYNPNNRPAEHDGKYRNRAVTDVFEPGSTIKTFSMINAFASGKYKPTSRIDTSPGWIYFGNKKIEDEHKLGVIDMTTLLAVSSNVGISKVTLSLPQPNSLWETLHAFGFGQVTDTGFPGESAGVLIKQNPWRPFMLATLSFGYSMSATPLQLAQAYCILANGGSKIPLSLLRIDHPPVGKQILDPKIVHEILLMLEAVISYQGTAPLAKVAGYRVTGKTGTTKLLSKTGGYEKHRYNGSFIGIAPASSPRILVAVVLHDPRGKQYLGGYTSGPIFSKIMAGTLRLMNVPPDNLSTLPVQTLNP